MKMNRIPLCLNIKVIKILAIEKMVRNRCMKFCHVFTTDVRVRCAFGYDSQSFFCFISKQPRFVVYIDIDGRYKPHFNLVILFAQGNEIQYESSLISVYGSLYLPSSIYIYIYNKLWLLESNKLSNCHKIHNRMQLNSILNSNGVVVFMLQGKIFSQSRQIG